MNRQNAAAIREKEIANGCVDKMNQIEYVDVDAGRNIAMDYLTDKRQKAKPDSKDNDPNPVVECPEKLQSGTYLLPVIPRNQFEHGASYGGTEPQFRQAQDSEN